MNSAAENDRALRREDQAPAAERQWRVLFIGDHGKVIAFKRIKTLIWLTVGLIATALLAVGVLVAVNAGLHARTNQLQEQLASLQLNVEALRQERDRLTAHVVLVETKMKETLAGVKRPAVGPKPDPAAAAVKAGDPPRPPPPEDAASPATESPPAAAEARVPVGIEESIAIEGFRAGWDAGRQTLDLRYRLVAARSARKPLAGHVIVVFKGDGLEPERWLAMPRVDLSKGRPSGRQKGFTFSISHSKAFAHSIPAPASLPAYTQAVVYVFSNEGQLLTARDYGVELKPSEG
jgi:cell division protein FtsB